MVNLCLALTTSALAISFTGAFQIQTATNLHHHLKASFHHHHHHHHHQHNTKLHASTISVERTSQRDINQYQNWAEQCGVQTNEGFYLEEDNTAEYNNIEEYYAATSTGGQEGSCVMYIPNDMILSSSRIADEYGSYVEPSFRVLQELNMQHLYQHFYLFLKVLVEYEQGMDSPYYPWVAAMPRKWNTAASMDDFCMSCLPPYIKKLCQVEKDQLDAFSKALQKFDYLSPESKADKELLKFAYNVVFTRSFTPSTSYDDDDDLQIIPMADMLNHGYPSNAALVNDENGNCAVTLTQDVSPGEPLLLSYGDNSNPSQLLATYGFLVENAPTTFCKMVFTNPSQELLDIGYDPSLMLFSTETGDIAPAVWDVLLYSRISRKRDMDDTSRAFYEAHMNNDEETKSSIHNMFFAETHAALLRHVNHILIEVHELMVNMNAFDASKHPRLPMLRRHHEMVTSTFQKVKANLEEMAP